MGISAVATLIASETVTTAMVLAAVAEVGTVLTVVGAVTGSEDLMKVGGVMGLVGGVGAWAANSASAGASAAGAAGADSAAFSQMDAAAVAADSGAAAATEGIANGLPTNGLINNAAEAGNSVAQTASVAAPDVAVQGAGADSAAFSQMDAAAVADGGLPEVANPYNAAQQVANPYDNPVAGENMDAWRSLHSDAMYAAPSNSLMPSNAFFDGIKNIGTWVETHPTVAKLGFGVMSGIQKQDELDRQYELKRQAQANASTAGRVTAVQRPQGIIRGATA